MEPSASFPQKTAKTYATRWLVASSVYLFFKLTTSSSTEEMLAFGPESFVYYTFTLAVFFFLWEVLDLTIKRHLELEKSKAFERKPLIKLYLVNLGISIPIIGFTSYTNNFIIADWVGCTFEDPESVFYQDLVKGFLVGLLFIAFIVFQLYYEHSRNTQLRMAELEREAALSKYESLKNQVNPHFLFNSFSVLTSLIYQNRDLASDFIAQLSKTYRYILENREKELVTLKKELEFLDSFLFLMNIRHEGSLKVEKNILLDPESYSIPTLSLQMLVDNAIKHNSFSEEMPLSIRIYTHENNIVVENNLQQRQQAPVSTKVGLSNIRNRYQFHTQQDVVVEKSEQTFQVKLPLLQSKFNVPLSA